MYTGVLSAKQDTEGLEEHRAQLTLREWGIE